MVIDLKIFFPALIIFLFLSVDVFLFNDLQIDEVKKFPAFKTVTLEGVEVTEKIFAEKITVLCIWTTTQENFEILSQLNEMQKNLPENVQVIGLVGDKNFADAEKIAKKYSPQILQLAVNDDFFPVLEKLRQAPTTIFIDANLNLVGALNHYLGADFCPRRKLWPPNLFLSRIRILHSKGLLIQPSGKPYAGLNIL